MLYANIKHNDFLTNSIATPVEINFTISWNYYSV